MPTMSMLMLTSSVVPPEQGRGHRQPAEEESDNDDHRLADLGAS